METMARIPYDIAVKGILRLLEANLLPDIVIRRLARMLLARRLRLSYKPNAELQLSDLMAFAQSLKQMPIALNTEMAKTQHYELPTSFFKLVLGKHLKYREQGLSNVVIFAADISNFDMESTFDRIISIEMFEHMKNYQDLLKKISLWMNQESLLFVHHFCCKAFAYHFEDHVAVVDHWLMNGKHYARTSEEWLRNMDKNLPSISPILDDTYGKNDAKKWMSYWRTFFIAVAELYGYNDGEEWMVAHFLFKKK